MVGSILNAKGDVIDSLAMKTEDAGDTWQRIRVPSKKELIHLDFNGSSHGWIVGDDGVIFATTDGGANWREQSSGTSMPLYNVDFRDDNEGYIVGKTGTILRTENGGATWQKVVTNFKDTLFASILRMTRMVGSSDMAARYSGRLTKVGPGFARRVILAHIFTAFL